MPSPRIVDALMFRCVGNHTYFATPSVEHIHTFRGRGWFLLADAREIRFADLDVVRDLEIRRFEDWRQAWDDGA
jgi:hypothetical protein